MRALRVLMPALALFLLVQAAAAAPVKLSTVVVSPGAFTPGADNVVGTVTLTGAAGKGGVSVSLTSSNPSVLAVPAAVVVPQGATSATFQPTAANAVAVSTNVTVTAVYGLTATATVTALPPVLSSFSSPYSELVGKMESAQATVVLNSFAPAGGMTVSLVSSNPAISVVPSVSIPAGQSAASVMLVANRVYTQTSVIVTATLGNVSRMVAITVKPCVAAHANAVPSFPATDIAWIDDLLPAGMTLTGGSWDTSQAAAGTQSLHAPEVSGLHTMTLSGASPALSLNPGEHLIEYFMLTNCTKPREIVFRWHTTAGVWKGAWAGEALIGGESGYVPFSMNVLEQTWQRLDIAASDLGIDGQSIDGFEVQLYDGELWVDHVSRSCVPPFATPPEQITDTIWVDDTGSSGDMTWDTAQHALGTRSLNLVSIYVSDYRAGDLAAAPQYVAVGEKLSMWVLLSACDTPSGLMIHWGLNGAYATWGSMTGGYHAGAMPPPGVWTRLEVPASALGLEDHFIDSVQVRIGTGTIWVDAIGKSGPGCIPATAAAPMIPAGDRVFVEDSTPAGASLTNASWDTSQHASGTKSATSPYASSGVRSFGVYNLSQPVHYGENLVAYVLLSECSAPPDALQIRWTATAGVYWGNPPTNWVRSPSLIPATTPMPAPGVWTRVEIPARSIGLEESTVDQADVDIAGAGKVWLDHVALSGTPCILSAPPAPSFPSGDEVWVDEPPASADSVNVSWVTDRAASGTYSLQGGLGTQVESLNGGSGYLVASTDRLFFYALINECLPPTELRVRYRLASGDIKGVYYGVPQLFEDGSRYMSAGAVPAGGQWIRFEVPVSQLGIVPGPYSGRITGVLIDVVGGRAWLDRFGRTSQ